MGLVTSKTAEATYQPKSLMGNYVTQGELKNFEDRYGDEIKKFTDTTYTPKAEFDSYKNMINKDFELFTRKDDFNSYRKDIVTILDKYQPKGDYVLSSDFNNFQKRFKDEIQEFSLRLDKKYQPISSNDIAVSAMPVVSIRPIDRMPVVSIPPTDRMPVVSMPAPVYNDVAVGGPPLISSIRIARNTPSPDGGNIVNFSYIVAADINNRQIQMVNATYGPGDPGIGFPASNVLDGELRTFGHTSLDNGKDFIEVFFESPTQVGKVMIAGRPGFTNRMVGTSVMLLDMNGNVVYNIPITSEKDLYTFTFESSNSSWIPSFIRHKNYLHY